ncbi:MAG TPA: dTDP-4-dehydrorhamnose reductase [Burkholderiales bacterium]|nr:dTDP-4-dehydrorhamnose reductase [Burkholderiales bacterium]
MKILLTGRNGQLGWELARTLAPLGELAAYDRTMLDLAKPDQIAAAVRSVKPDIIVNAGAYTAVDKAESEPEAAFAVNAVAPGLLAEEAKRAGALLIHYSTDYVFDGAKEMPYVEEDPHNPLNVYGRSKLAGELAVQSVDGSHLILRTSWVYAARGRNFFLTIRRLLKEKSELRVVSDQIGAPTSARALAEATAELLRRHGVAALRGARGVYHVTAAGFTSWHGFATEIARLERPNPLVRIIPIASSEYPTPAPRPKNSRLSNEKLRRSFGIALPQWETCLETCHAGLKRSGRVDTGIRRSGL